MRLVLTLAPALRDTWIWRCSRPTRGALPQLTTITLVAAPPSTVRELVAHPERARAVLDGETPASMV